MSKRVKPITESDLPLFIEQLELIKTSEYIISSNKSKVEIIYEDGVLKHSATLPERRDIESILMRIRPFIQPSERFYLIRVIDYLESRYGKSAELNSWRVLFEDDGANKYPAITFNGKKYRIKDLFNIYLYGKYFHLDKKKQKVYIAFENQLGKLSEFFAYSQIDQYLGIIFGVGAFIRKNKLHLANDK